LTCDQVRSAHVNKSTVLPSYLRDSACSEGTTRIAEPNVR
jgi:hypothetical protein